MNKFLIGCAGVLLIVAILIGVLILETPRFLDAGKKAVSNLFAEEARIAGVENAWQPPSKVRDAQWFPASIGDWKLEKSEPTESVPALALARAGYGGIYRSPRGLIEVSIVPVRSEEKSAVLESAQEALSARRDLAQRSGDTGTETATSRTTGRLTTTRGNRTYFRLGGSDHTRFWFLKGYLLIFRASGAADSETFPEEFLRASTATPLP